ncbi:MAG: hypothetical protein JNJ98_19130 [Gemmatimonadetes bacterium]|nr:hypothetical protein [Gemmatimonadota bacterium]
MTRNNARAALVALVAAGSPPLSLQAQQVPPQPLGYHVVALPLTAGTGSARETHVVLETPHLKLATVVLRNGAILEEHSAPTPVTIQVVSGRGTVTLGAASETVSAGSLLALSPGLTHVIRPDAGTDMVLVVHHLKTPQRPRRAPGT